MSGSREPEEIVVLERAPSTVIAEMIVSALQSAGIPAYVKGKFLQDEWAVSQRVLGLSGVEIQVSRSRLEEAKELLAEMREAGRILAEREDKREAEEQKEEERESNEKPEEGDRP